MNETEMMITAAIAGKPLAFVDDEAAELERFLKSLPSPESSNPWRNAALNKAFSTAPDPIDSRPLETMFKKEAVPTATGIGELFSKAISADDSNGFWSTIRAGMETTSLSKASASQFNPAWNSRLQDAPLAKRDVRTSDWNSEIAQDAEPVAVDPEAEPTGLTYKLVKNSAGSIVREGRNSKGEVMSSRIFAEPSAVVAKKDEVTDELRQFVMEQLKNGNNAKQLAEQYPDMAERILRVGAEITNARRGCIRNENEY